MAPRFAFRASKFRNIECKPAARDASYDQLHVTTAAVEGNVVAATTDRFAFAHQMDGGAAIQVKALSDTGKDTIPALLRGHQARVNALEFSPFRCDLLLSASADATVKLWKLPNDPATASVPTASVSTLATTGTSSSVVSVKHHPSAASIATAISHRELLVFDLETEALVASHTSLLDASSDDAFSSVAWNYDGSVILTSSSYQHVRILDPRTQENAVVSEFKAHAGRRRPTSVLWCGRRELFVTTGSDPMQERELKLWDARNLTTPVHRERLDTSIGQLFPLYDPDVDLLYMLGKGDRSVRCLEVSDGCQKLSQTLLPHMTFGAALVPKQACDTSACEVARVLSLSADAGVCDVLSFTVPRKDAAHEFQSDLYPDTMARTPAMRSDQWTRGENAEPVRDRVTPHSNNSGNAKSYVAVAGEEKQSRASTSTGWGQAAAVLALSPWDNITDSRSSSTATTSGWTSKATAWNAPPPDPPAPPLVERTAPPPEPVTVEAEVEVADDTTTDKETDTISEKMARFTTAQGHKLKYITGTQSTRSDVLHLGDKVASSSSIHANDSFLAIPLMGAGGPVLVTSLDAMGRVTADDTVLNGHKAAVVDVAFHPFQSHVLATGSSDSTIAIWKLAGDTTTTDHHQQQQQHQELRGHTKSVRSVTFHPRAADVLCSTSQDLSIRLWDVETGAERVCLANKLEDSVWNAAFSEDGALLATSSRARIVRVFDPRQQVHGHALVSMGCGFDSIRPQYVTWLGDSTHLLTLGTTGAPRHETQLRIWDARNLVDPLSTISIDAAAAESVPMYDASSRVLFIAAVGGRHIWSYEIGAAGAMDVVHANLPFVADGHQPISAAALLPKRLCDVRNVEIDRLALLRGPSVERVSFSLPRNEKLRQYFQDDVYGDVLVRTPSLSASQWFDKSADVVLQYESLRPADMTPLSQKPRETLTQVPMSQRFKAKWEEEEREKQLKADNMARLQALASQPSLHSNYQHQQQTNGQTQEDDSDDDWDE